MVKVLFREYGKIYIKYDMFFFFFSGIFEYFVCWMSYIDFVEKFLEGFKVLVFIENCLIVVFGDDIRKIYVV